MSGLVSHFPPTFTGRLVTPADADYDIVRQVHNGFVDKRPALIAQCRGTADVVDAVKAARAAGVPAAVRGGGHNVAGRATIEGSLLTRRMRRRRRSAPTIRGCSRSRRGGTRRISSGRT